MNKPKVAIFDFAGCEGCQLQIVNMEEEILDLISIVRLVEWREGMSEQSEEYDVAIIEGSITRPQDEEKLRQIRERAKILVALGACATDGGVNKMKNRFDLQEVKQLVYGADSALPHLDSAPTKAVDEIVQVDHKIYGCPIDRREFATVVRSLILGKRPDVPNYPVCVECKRRENVCRYEYQEICLGPITRAGCDARCPSFGAWCFGCRGPVDEPNAQAARVIMERYGKRAEDLEDRMQLFGHK